MFQGSRLQAAGRRRPIEGNEACIAPPPDAAASPLTAGTRCWKLQRDQERKSPFVFISERGTPFSKRGFQAMVDRAARTAGTPPCCRFGAVISRNHFNDRLGVGHSPPYILTDAYCWLLMILNRICF